MNRIITHGHDYSAIELRGDLLDLKSRFLRFWNTRYTSRPSESKSYHDLHRTWNPGWSFGTERVFLNWTHFRRHCWHLSITCFGFSLGISYGKMHP